MTCSVEDTCSVSAITDQYSYLVLLCQRGYLVLMLVHMCCIANNYQGPSAIILEALSKDSFKEQTLLNLNSCNA